MILFKTEGNNMTSWFCWFDLWCLTSLSTIFQLYRGGQFYCWRKPECPEKTFCYHSTYGICQITKYRVWKAKKNAIFNLSSQFGCCTHNYYVIDIVTKRKRTKRQTTIHKTQHRKINQHEPHKKLLGYLDRIVFLDYVFKSFNFVRSCWMCALN
jgi:hypothetical protein